MPGTEFLRGSKWLVSGSILLHFTSGLTAVVSLARCMWKGAANWNFRPRGSSNRFNTAERFGMRPRIDKSATTGWTAIAGADIEDDEQMYTPNDGPPNLPLMLMIFRPKR
jgi:hypothetical protein